MANYVAHYTKKREILGRKEDALRRFIARGVGEQKLTRAAEEVCAARIRVLQARLATIPPKDGPETDSADRIVSAMEVLRAASAETILAEFGVRLTR